jgi:diguanylate cyclase (GGDEF)-like protein
LSGTEDPLTGLPNRHQFEDALQIALGSPPRAGASHGVLRLELSGFARINELHGQAVGDELLIAIGNRLRNAVRHGDLVARLGGDEFGILAPHVAGPEAATSVALRVIAGLADAVTVGSHNLRVGVAIGIALVPQDAASVEEALRNAATALHRARAEGRSAHRFFEPAMDASIRERDRIETELRAAIAGGIGLRPFYQPQVDLKSGAIAGFEALARWTHPTLGEIEPARFIAIAEECGLIGDLTMMLFRQACRDAMRWPEETVLSFNISPVELGDAALPARLMRVLGETGFPARRLEIEITESALVRDLDAAKAILGTMRAAGAKIALDDFGTGYSSLYHLRNFKLDKIKIDRSFIEAMAHDPNSATIVRALIGLGAGLNLTVTAEGVADAGQRAALLAAGCQLGQGYLLGEPVSADRAAALVA